MTKASLIAAVENNASLADDEQVERFASAVDALAAKKLDASDVTRLVLALKGDEDRDDVRWSVVHLVEKIAAKEDAYLAGILAAMEKAPTNRFVELLLGRLSNSRKEWPAVKRVFGRIGDAAARKKWLASLRDIASRSEVWSESLEQLAKTLTAR